jgi:murein DD-endopeptidase MepM/ murein hydrolase activator NlpD
MARIKYYYDTETCRYERVKTSRLDVFLNAMGFLCICIFFGFIVSMVKSEYFPSSKEIKLEKENEELLFSYRLLSEEMESLKDMFASLEERDNNIYRVIFEVDQIPNEVRRAGIGGTQRYQKLLEQELTHEEMILSTAQRIDQLKRRMYIQTNSYDELTEIAKDKSKMLASIPAIRPISDEDMSRFASGFGMRIDPFLKIRRMHTGCDFSAPRGTPIYATGDGVVITAERNPHKGYGNQIEIDHGYGYVTKYAHMESFDVRQGQKVKRGQKIGTVGNTGRSVAPHVHYEVLHNDRKVNPINFFNNDVTPEQYEVLLQKAAVENQSLGH